MSQVLEPCEQSNPTVSLHQLVKLQGLYSSQLAGLPPLSTLELSEEYGTKVP